MTFLLVLTIGVCAGFIGGHLHCAAINHIGPFGDPGDFDVEQLPAMGRALDGRRHLREVR